ncbi:hypothetical protein DYB34_011196 [Aphanomyces astaci]|uniref:ADP/ATP translocase n=1 Tax=Aphanomyces astaci TaxID=112090 RepID=A0A3R6ZI28_APHAT|nr:hypothetical protein DYB34_011196 [Aphanomyces astaci]
MGFWRFFLCNMAAGGAAGATSLAAVYPLDFARTGSGPTSVSAAPPRPPWVVALPHGHVPHERPPGAVLGVRGVCGGDHRVPRVALWRVRHRSRRVADQGRPLVAKMDRRANGADRGGLLSYPLDTVRRRMMMQVGRPDVLYANTWHCWRTICTTEGVRRRSSKARAPTSSAGPGQPSSWSCTTKSKQC